MAHPTETRLLTARDLMERLNLSRTGIYRLLRKGDLPRPLYLTPKLPRWPEVAIESWLAAPGLTVSLAFARTWQRTARSSGPKR